MNANDQHHIIIINVCDDDDVIITLNFYKLFIVEKILVVSKSYGRKIAAS